MALNALDASKIPSLNEGEKLGVLKVFEQVFNHKAFTGRSGTFFGYEGLGSIYWHMVSKLLLAVEEVFFKSESESTPAEKLVDLQKIYYNIKKGIGAEKSPDKYGAFPTDPYSHTPSFAGVQQPGMTGQVKEDIISRFRELGVFAKQGKIYINTSLINFDEFLKNDETYIYYDVNGKEQSIS